MTSQDSSPNLKAKSIRHRRVFIFRLILDLKGMIGNLTRRFIKRSDTATHLLLDKPIEVRDPFACFLRQTVVIGMALLFVTSLTPGTILDTGLTVDYFGGGPTEFIEEDQNVPPFLMNEEGFILKTDDTPVSYDTPLFTDTILHTVVPGETCSGITALYGIKTTTLIWENDLSEDCKLKIGQTLVVLPYDGVNHVVTKGQTIKGIAKLYGVEEEVIMKYNGEGEIKVGQKLFIKDGKRQVPVYVRSGIRSDERPWSGNTFDTKLMVVSQDEPREGKSFIWPIVGGKGSLTQGFHTGHLALDIADASKPDTVAIASGVIVKAEGGCPSREVKIWRNCNGGYGNYVILQVDPSSVGFGDDVKSVQLLYAHMDPLYVTQGQNVERGTALGRTSNSGSAWGVTGRHLHIELYINGVKKNLLNFM